jgi:maleate cis-trans isomerase
MAVRTTVGLLYPGYAAEDDYPVIEKLLGPSVSLPVVHTSVGEDAHRVNALLDLGATDRLVQCAAQLRRFDVDAVVWACTSGSFVFGWEGAQAQTNALRRALGVPASSTSFAFVHAARALGLGRVAVAATYPEDVASHFVEFLRRGDIDVIRLSSRGMITAAEVGMLGLDEVLDLAAANDHPDADAALLPDTALHTAAWLDELEDRLGKPVLTANQVSVWEGLRIARHWEGLRIARHTEPHTGLGTLFRQGQGTGGESGEVSQ